MRVTRNPREDVESHIKRVARVLGTDASITGGINPRLTQSRQLLMHRSLVISPPTYPSRGQSRDTGEPHAVRLRVLLIAAGNPWPDGTRLA